jgi:YegS/Rv2252/BmrU family lipid kinase
MKKVLFVINPISGGNAKEACKQTVEAWWQQHGIHGQWMETSGEQDLEQLEALIKTQAPDTVVACGGDGTVNLVARALLGTSIHMGILPVGSANGLATELCIPENVPEALDVLLHAQPFSMDGLLINGKHYAFHLADVGYNARLIQEFESEKVRGKRAYARSFLKVARNRPLAKLTISTDEKTFSKRSVMATFANARQYGTGAIVNPEGRLDDGQFELCLFLPWPRWYLLWMSVLFFIGQIDKSRYVKIIRCRSLKVETDRPMPLQIDGELAGEQRSISVEISPDKVQVLSPMDI